MIISGVITRYITWAYFWLEQYTNLRNNLHQTILVTRQMGTDWWNWINPVHYRTVTPREQGLFTQQERLFLEIAELSTAQLSAAHHFQTVFLDRKSSHTFLILRWLCFQSICTLLKTFFVSVVICSYYKHELGLASSNWQIASLG